MKSILKLLSYAGNFKKWIIGNFIFNLCYVFLQLTTLLLTMPVLKFLFSSDKEVIKVTGKTQLMGSWFTQKYEGFMIWFTKMAEQDTTRSLMFLCIGLISITIVKNLMRYGAMNFMVLIINNSIKNLRTSIYKKALKLPISYFNEERKGDLLSRMSNDMKEIEFSLMVSLEALYFQPLNILVFFTALLLLSAKLTFLVLLFLPVTALLIGLLGKALRRKSAKNQFLAGKILSTFEETLGGMRVIKAFTAENRFYEKYKQIDAEFTKNNIGVQRRMDLSSPISETIGISISSVLLWFGGRMVFKGELEPEFFLAYFTIFSQLIPPFKAFSSAIYASQKGMASINRIEELVTAPEIVKDPELSKKVVFNTALKFENVSFAYQTEPVLKDIQIDIQKGKTIALVGASGSGKTTLADLTARFYDVTNGKITLDGTDIREFAQQDLRKIIGIVAQESLLFNETITYNLLVGKKNASANELVKACKAANAHDFIMSLENGYDTLVGERGSKLSGGQRQRVCIARALLKNPEILILDEATSALDSESEKAVQGALEHLMQNRTSIVIAHRLSTVQNADTILVLEKGVIKEQGTHKVLLEQGGIYSNLIKLQQLH